MFSKFTINHFLSVQDFIKKQVSAERKQQREVGIIQFAADIWWRIVVLSLFHLQAKAERRKRIEEMSAETRAFYENIRFYKFYPQPSPGTPDISALKVGQALLTQKSY